MNFDRTLKKNFERTVKELWKNFEESWSKVWLTDWLSESVSDRPSLREASASKNKRQMEIDHHGKFDLFCFYTIPKTS